MQLFTLWMMFTAAGSAEENAESIYGFDEIVVVIEEHILTKSDIQRDLALHHLLPINSVVLQENRVQNAIEGLVQIEVINQMAGDTSLYQAKEPEINVRLQAFKSKVGESEYRAYLTSIHLTEEQLRLIIERQIVAEKYVYRNLGITQDSQLQSAQQKYSNWLLLTKEKLNIRYIN